MAYKELTFIEKQKTFFERRKKLRDNPTRSEKRFMEILDNLHIKYIFQKAFIKDYYCIVDFYLPNPARTVIEIDGDSHNEVKQILKDMRRDKYLTQDRGFKVVRITNEEVWSDEIVKIIHARLK